MMYSIRILFFVLISSPLIGQISILQDASGASSIILETTEDSAMFNLNMANKSASIGLVKKIVEQSESSYLGGVQLTVSGRDGELPTLKGGLANFKIEVNATWYWLLGGGTFNFLYVMPNFGGTRLYTVSEPNSATLVEIKPKSSVTGTVQLGFNSLSIHGSRAFIGLAAKLGVSDNADRIENVQYGQSNYVGVDKHGNPVFVTDDVKNGFSSAEFRNNIFTTNTLLDFGCRFGRFSPAIHLRADSYAGDGKKIYFSPGGGLYFTQKSKPSRPLIGLQYFIKDCFDENGANSPLHERKKINVVIGFSF